MQQRTQFVNTRDASFREVVRRGFVAIANVLRQRYEYVANSITKGRSGLVPDYLGGSSGLSDTGDCSRDLGNSDHIDLDASMSCSMFC